MARVAVVELIGQGAYGKVCKAALEAGGHTSSSSLVSWLLLQWALMDVTVSAMLSAFSSAFWFLSSLWPYGRATFTVRTNDEPLLSSPNWRRVGRGLCGVRPAPRAPTPIGVPTGASAAPLIAISAGWLHTVGLRTDGKGAAVGDNEDGQCNVSTW